MTAFADATGRGVRLRILTRDISLGDRSNASTINELSDRVRREGNTDRLHIVEVDKENFPDASLHAKALVADGTQAYIGSANLTRQSLQNAVELGLYLEGEPVKDVKSYIDRCWESDLFVNPDT